ncbi:LPS assembly protein LptD [Sphingomonas sp. BK345]|uniref:LPS assembly protein LptD n=1 Tax=Sphingomonas sp. BK345 TaxID=2586980 RepID=UPI0018233D26|nr:LPS assembly protein LptD [Sphingomonas sp. BK345]MBB3475472.1 LPS-assembly protein [Sphingomonas sp. BK345]
MTRNDLLAGGALWLLAAVPAAAQAPGAPVAPAMPAASTPAPAAATETEQVQFSAAALEYDTEADIVTATGEVRMTRGADRLRAERVVWNRKTGKVVATGNVAVTDPEGDIAYGDSIELTDTLRDGMVDNLLVVLEQGGRLAAVRGTREPSGIYNLDHAVYSPCAVTDSDGCPKEPAWKITAVKVTYDADRQRVSYEGARFHLFGLTSPSLPRFSHSIAQSNDSGLLTPSIGLTRLNGAELVLPFNFALGPSRSLVIAPHLFSSEVPMLEARYSAVNELGAYSIAGYATSSRRSDDLSSGFVSDTTRAFRGYLDGSGRFQLDPNWSISGSMRIVTDRTFLRRYDISNDDRLRTTIALERIDTDSYFSLAGWAVQTLRVGDRQGMQPVALPELDYRRRITDAPLGGVLQLQFNTLAVGRKAGQDTQRAFASARWDWRGVTVAGQEVTLTAYARGDAYNSDDTVATAVDQYRGVEGFQTRAIGALAADVRWPFVGELFGGLQRFSPRVQVVATPRTRNIQVPNEDARAVDLEDSNLFALNRFPGYDRWEDSSRVTYGADWSLDLPGVAITTNVGQSYRLNSRPSILPDGTGLSDRFSDIVGRTNVRIGEFVTLTHRYRLDKDNFAVRRNELDATVGSRRTYASVGYLRLNRDITELEDLQDREEVRAGGRVAFARFWSLWGSAVVDLTDRAEDPLSQADGFTPIRHRLGVAYQDDCLELGLTWKRDYRTVGDARRGDSYLLTLSFKNLGR